MPKLRHGSSDTGKFANWLGRKVVNHNALAEVKMSASQRDATPDLYAAKGKGTVHQIGDDENTIVCEVGDGRAFKVSVTEMDRGEFEEVKDRFVALQR